MFEKMLLIDGVKYELWTPPSEDELEQIIIEHAKDIFGENSIYLDKKQNELKKKGILSLYCSLIMSLLLNEAV